MEERRKFWRNAGDNDEGETTYEKQPIRRSVLVIEKPVSCSLCPLCVHMSKRGYCALALAGPIDVTSIKPHTPGTEKKHIDPLIYDWDDESWKGKPLDDQLDWFATYRNENCPLEDLPDYYPEDRAEPVMKLINALNESEKDGFIHTDKDARDCMDEDRNEWEENNTEN